MLIAFTCTCVCTYKIDGKGINGKGGKQNESITCMHALTNKLCLPIDNRSVKAVPHTSGNSHLIAMI